MEKLFESQAVFALFLIFFVPGFVSLKVYDLLVPSERRDFSKSIYDAVAYSAINFVMLFWLIARMRSGVQGALEWYLSFFLVLIGMPSAWPIIFLWILKRPPLSRHVAGPNCRVWDVIFSKRDEHWVVVHLKDGRRIGGLYSTRSVASSNPAQPEIFLEEIYQLDEETGAFGNRIDLTEGILILGDEILGIEFFRYDRY